MGSSHHTRLQEDALSVGGCRLKVGFVSVLVTSLGLGLASCATDDAAEDEATTTQESPEAPETSVEIPSDTLAGEQSQHIVELLNADEDTTAADVEEHLHSSFTAEVSVDELVELFNQNLRPAQPFTVAEYQGGDRQAVSVLTSPVSDPLDMTVTVDTEGLITGLLFTPSASDG